MTYEELQRDRTRLMFIIPERPLSFCLVVLSLLLSSSVLGAQEDADSTDRGTADSGATQVPLLEPVTVTILRTPQSLKTLTASANVLDRAYMDLLGARTVEEVVMELPGLNVVGSARYGQEVRLNERGVTNGFGTQRALVLLDGRPLTDEYLGTVDLAQYPLDAISRIELVRGPASALYGTNAMGGVLNLIPRRGSPVAVTEFVGQGGTFRTGSAALSHGRMLGPVDLFLSLSGSTTNGYLENSAGDAVDWETRSVFSNTGYEGKKLGLRVYGGFFHGSGTDEDFNRDLNRNLEDVGFWVRGARPETETRLRLYRSALHQTLDWFSRPASDYDQSSLGAILTQTHRMLPAHLVTGGLEWRLEEATVEELAGIVDRDATTWAGFLQDEVEVGDALGIVVGVRFDAQGETQAVSYRGGANYRPAPGTILRASVGRAFRVPTISDRFLPTTSFFGVTFEGNPDLDPESLVSLDAGVAWEIVGGRVRADVTGFATWARDFYDFLLQPDDVFRPENIARVNIYGIEGQVLANLGLGFEAAGSYTYTNAYYDEFLGNEAAEGNRLDDNVLHQGAVSLAYRGPAGHAGRLIVTACGDRFTDPENTLAGRLSPFVVADIALSMPIRDKLAVTLQLQNVTDTSYRTRPEFRQPGRTVTAAFRVLF